MGVVFLVGVRQTRSFDSTSLKPYADFLYRWAHVIYYFRAPLAEYPHKAALPDPAADPDWYGEMSPRYPDNGALFPSGLGIHV